jgi:hypothetical protein
LLFIMRKQFLNNQARFNMKKMGVNVARFNILGSAANKRGFRPAYTPGNPSAEDVLDTKIDKRRAKSKWQGDAIDIQHTLLIMFQLD